MLTRRMLPVAALGFAFVLLIAAAPAQAQTDEPMPPPAPEGEGDEPRPPALPPPAPSPMVQPAPAPAPMGPAVDPERPVERASDGLWGFSWRFGGMATMAATGNVQAAGEVTVTQIAVKYAPSEEWRIPFYVGTGLKVRAPEGQDANADWAMGFGGGFEYHFRIWRRISPFIGATLGLGITDPAGDANWQLAIGLGPQLGIEYFIGDRLAVQALYQFILGFHLTEGLFQFGFSTASGGLLGIGAYF